MLTIEHCSLRLRLRSGAYDQANVSKVWHHEAKPNNKQTNKTRKGTCAGKVKRHGGIYHSASILWEFRRGRLQGERQQLEEEDGPPELGNRGISPA